jgi:hypothetical protein
LADDFKTNNGKAANQQSILALQNAYQNLLQQEQDLIVAIGRVKNALEYARRKWITRPWGMPDPQLYQYRTDAAANLPALEGRLENVGDERKRVRDELARAERESR